jgi:hypothetical protein
MMTTLRREDSFDSLRSTTNELMSTAVRACVDFLRIELELAQTLLAMAANAREESSRKRRIARAAEAAAVVERFIVAPPPPVRLSDSERERIANELNRVKERLTSMH